MDLTSLAIFYYKNMKNNQERKSMFQTLSEILLGLGIIGILIYIIAQFVYIDKTNEVLGELISSVEKRTVKELEKIDLEIENLKKGQNDK